MPAWRSIPTSPISPSWRPATTQASAAGDAPPRALARTFCERFDYRGDSETYDDTQNADLIRVIRRRRGLPVALGILYLHAARAQGWPAVGLNFPNALPDPHRRPPAVAR